MTPEQKQALIKVLQETIDKIDNLKENQKIGLLLSVGVEKEGDQTDMFENASLLIGYNYVVAHNLAQNIRTDKDYIDLFERTMRQL